MNEDIDLKLNCESCSKEPTDKINVVRFIAKIDECFKTNDLQKAENLIETWTNDALALNDLRGLLTVQNEGLGLYRRTNDYNNAIKTIELVKNLLDGLKLLDSVSGATILVNLATTMKAFGKAKEALSYYEQAEQIYAVNGLLASFEYTALLNNRASCLDELDRFDEAERDLLNAIEILKKDGSHDGEIAVSLINLAHVVYNRNDKDTSRVEEILDSAWEFINSPNQPHDSNYAFILSKIAPSFRYFKRTDEADAMEAVFKVIYGSNV